MSVSIPLTPALITIIIDDDLPSLAAIKQDVNYNISDEKIQKAFSQDPT